jgi:hypothetical protein
VKLLEGAVRIRYSGIDRDVAGLAEVALEHDVAEGLGAEIDGGRLVRGGDA